MPYFKDKTGKVHFIEKAGDSYLLPDGCIEITKQQAEHDAALLNEKTAAVSKRQAEKALYLAGRLNEVEAAISAMPEPDQTLARIDWEKATEVKRDWPLTQQLAAALGLSDAELDQLFETAAGL